MIPEVGLVVGSEIRFLFCDLLFSLKQFNALSWKKKSTKMHLNGKISEKLILNICRTPFVIIGFVISCKSLDNWYAGPQGWSWPSQPPYHLF